MMMMMMMMMMIELQAFAICCGEKFDGNYGVKSAGKQFFRTRILEA